MERVSLSVKARTAQWCVQFSSFQKIPPGRWEGLPYAYTIFVEADRDWITDAMIRMGEAFEKATAGWVRHSWKLGSAKEVSSQQIDTR